MPREPFILLEDVSKGYSVGGQPVHALDHLTLSIDKGDMCALMGPSGAGKTTLLNMIGGLDVPDSGKVMVGGLDLSRLNEMQRASFRKRNVGFIFQFYNLIPSLTAYENVLVPVMFERDQRRSRAEELLDRMGLSRRMDHRPSELSGGERQRVAIARALMNDPPLILADEPTGNIDSETAREIVSLFRQLNDEGKTLIMATHDRMMAGKARSMLRMRDGRISGIKASPRSSTVHLGSAQYQTQARE
ncbi:MAG: ABC transporter ATP-binding protein [Candidatus Thermoplasmatota archaeon]|jgi:putative ABC transport system ATP-binding protein|nr:ABC transporter ATP-binding protein [Candidatus Thermoplasmatota archaeon]